MGTFLPSSFAPSREIHGECWLQLTCLDRVMAGSVKGLEKVKLKKAARSISKSVDFSMRILP